MKEFAKTTLAVICGFVILRMLGLMLFLLMLGASLVSGSRGTLPRSGVLDLDLSAFQMAEQSQETATGGLFTTGFSMRPQPIIGLNDAVRAIGIAAGDPAVKYILLRPDIAAMGVADAEELRAALAAFRRSGKPVVAYTENPGNASYFLSTVADKIYMGPQHGGTYQLIGLSGRMTFVKNLLDKLGVHVQLIRHGKYKSAGEMFISNTASPANREQNQAMISSVWNSLSCQMAESRDIPVETINELVDNLSLNTPEDFLNNGLVDELTDHETLLERLSVQAGVEDSRDLALIPFPDYVLNKTQSLPGRTNVAVIFADGDIVDGKEYNGVAADRFVRIIDDVRKDKSVKAAVLRVNSPGGSVAASVKIRTALDLLQKEKPLVASYGNYAASGGYWISSGCQKIYADATTITGSIGVFSMIPEFSQVTRNIGLGVESVNSNKHSDMFSLTRPFDTEELAYMQASVEDIYERFVTLVAESRQKETAEVDAIAQGRVWTGSDALGIGLVDEIGTLEDAVAYAAVLADLHSSDEYSVVAYPKPLTLMEQLMMSFGQSPEGPSILSGTPFQALEPAIRALQQGGRPERVYARLPYALEIR